MRRHLESDVSDACSLDCAHIHICTTLVDSLHGALAATACSAFVLVTAV